jgi:hypothetical protein
MNMHSDRFAGKASRQIADRRAATSKTKTISLALQGCRSLAQRRQRLGSKLATRPPGPAPGSLGVREVDEVLTSSGALEATDASAPWEAIATHTYCGSLTQPPASAATAFSEPVPREVRCSGGECPKENCDGRG